MSVVNGQISRKPNRQGIALKRIGIFKSIDAVGRMGVPFGTILVHLMLRAAPAAAEHYVRNDISLPGEFRGEVSMNAPQVIQQVGNTVVVLGYVYAHPRRVGNLLGAGGAPRGAADVAWILEYDLDGRSV